jgi:MFS family permease
LVLADLMKGTGRFNLSLGALATVQGLGAALSSVVAGFIVVKAGYSFAFLLLAVVATGALLLFFFCMPETKNLSSNQGAEPGVRPGFASGARAE